MPSKVDKKQDGKSLPRVVVVRRAVPERLCANFSAAGSKLDLTVLETCPDEVHRTAGADDVPLDFELVSSEAFSISKIHSYLDQIKPDVLLCFGWADFCSLASLTWAKSNGRRVILSTNTSLHDYPRNATREFLKARLVLAFDLVWTAGQRSAHYIQTLGFPKERIHIGGLNTFDLEHFDSGASAARASDEHVRTKLKLPEKFFLCSARLAPEKNHAGLFQAFAAFRRKVKNHPWDLVLIGSGPLEGKLRALAKSLEIEEYVHFVGFVTHDELPAYYGLASALVLNSLRETWGIVVSEAAAARLPLLVSKHAGSAPELIEEGVNGYLIDPSSVTDIADKMAKISHGLVDIDEMGRHSRKLVEGHDPEAYGEALSMQAKRVIRMEPSPFGLIARIACRMQLTKAV